MTTSGCSSEPEHVITSSNDKASTRPSFEPRLSIPPLPLPLPQVKNGSDTTNASVTKVNESPSSSQQPLRFLANSVSISVTNSANSQKTLTDEGRDVSTESRKRENLMISSSVSCINPRDIQQVRYLFWTLESSFKSLMVHDASNRVNHP